MVENAHIVLFCASPVRNAFLRINPLVLRTIVMQILYLSTVKLSNLPKVIHTQAPVPELVP